MKEGDKDIPLGTPVAIIVSKKEDIAAFENYSPEAAKAPSKPSQSSAPATSQPTPSAQP